MNVLMVDDHSVFRAGLGPVLKRLDPNVRLFEAHDFDSALKSAEGLSGAVERDHVTTGDALGRVAGGHGNSRFTGRSLSKKYGAGSAVPSVA